MGEIFRRVAAIAPIDIRPRLALPDGMSVKQLRMEAVKRGLDTRAVAEKAELVALLKQSQSRELQKASVKELRAEAVRRGLDTRGIVDRADLVRLLDGDSADEACSADIHGGKCKASLVD